MMNVRSESRQDFRTHLPKLLTSSATLLLGFLLGCGAPDAAPKTSLFEDDHAVAAHWPDDLADVAVKLRDRLSASAWNEQSIREIEDLVSWTAEVAADTNLPEADWLLLYHASESLRESLHGAKGSLSEESRTRIESLCRLIDDTVPKIPEPKETPS